MTDNPHPTKQANAATFISYSANGEDVVLHRLFGHRKRGFYVDVGAAHPTFENDTRALYDQGWSGINIEPNPTFFGELAIGRPRDRNLQVAVSDEQGTLAYWEVVGTGLSTCDPDEASRAAAKGFEVNETCVPARTLAEILSEAHAPAIDLLKVDVEGFELNVLRGNDWSRHRPSLIIVEVTYPETPERRPDRIRPFLEQNGYRFAYFDGLNDYFVESMYSVPEDAFRPNNVFDHVLPYPVAALREHVSNLEHAAHVHAEFTDSLRAHLTAAEEERDVQAAALLQLQEQVGAVEAERSRQQIEIERLTEQATQTGIQLRDVAAVSARSRRLIIGLEARSVRDLQEATNALEAARSSGERSLLLRKQLDRAALTEAELQNSIRHHAIQQDLAEEIADNLTIQLADVRETLWKANKRTDEIRQELDSAREERDLAREWLNAVRSSTSWRISRPVRVILRLIGRR